MAKTKTTTNGGDTKNYGTVDLAAIRSNFDELQKTVNSFPEGKQKKNLMNKIEDVYFWTASTFKGLTSAPAMDA